MSQAKPNVTMATNDNTMKNQLHDDEHATAPTFATGHNKTKTAHPPSQSPSASPSSNMKNQENNGAATTAATATTPPRVKIKQGLGKMGHAVVGVGGKAVSAVKENTQKVLHKVASKNNHHHHHHPLETTENENQKKSEHKGHPKSEHKIDIEAKEEEAKGSKGSKGKHSPKQDIHSATTTTTTTTSKSKKNKHRKKPISPRRLSDELEKNTINSRHTTATLQTHLTRTTSGDTTTLLLEEDEHHHIHHNDSFLSPPHPFGIVLLWRISVVAVILLTLLYLSLLEAQQGQGVIHTVWTTLQGAMGNMEETTTATTTCSSLPGDGEDTATTVGASCMDQAPPKDMEDMTASLTSTLTTLILWTRYGCNFCWIFCAYATGQVWGLEHIYQLALVLIWAMSTIVPMARTTQTDQLQSTTATNSQNQNNKTKEQYSLPETMARAVDLVLLILSGQTRGTNMSHILWEEEEFEHPDIIVTTPDSDTDRKLGRGLSRRNRGKGGDGHGHNRPDKKLFQWVQRKTTGVRRRAILGRRHDNNDHNNTQPNGEPSDVTTFQSGSVLSVVQRRRALQSSLQSYLNFHNVNNNNENAVASDGPTIERPAWLRRLDPTRDSTNNAFMERLLGNPEYARVRRDNSATNDDTTMTKAGESADSSQESLPSNDDSQLGQTAAPATTTDFRDVGDYVIQPLLSIRGMDIFVTDDPQAEIHNHPWFVDQGLRQVPTFLMNGITQWGNVLIYFRMPEWVQDFDESLEEKPDDPMDVRAFKLFLKGDDDYRNERLKFVPAVVDGPMPIRVMAPPKKERTIHGTMIPITWTLHQKQVTESGKVLQPLVCCCMDAMSNTAVRNLTSLVKKYLAKLTADVALVIGEPRHDDKRNENDDEPKCCLGMFRFEHVEVDKCPAFPHQYVAAPDDTADLSSEDSESIAASEQAVDLQKASLLCGISTTELHELTEELKSQ